MAKSDLILQDGEALLGVVEGEMFAVYTNPLMNFFANIVKIISRILGSNTTGQITVTDRRIVLEIHKTVCWVFPSAASFKTILPQGVASVEYAFKATLFGCLLKKYVVSVAETGAESTSLVIKGGAKAASDFANLIIGTLAR